MNAGEIWTAALGKLQVDLNRHNFETWLAGSTATALDASTLTVRVPSEFHRTQLTERLGPAVAGAVERVTGLPLGVQYIVSPAAECASLRADLPAAMPALRYPAPRFRRGWSFETFVGGSCNRLALSAAHDFLASDAAPNPLFLCGPVGVGKTHLLHAIGQEATARRLKVLITTGEEFMRSFVRAFREDEMARFDERFEGIDLLIVDDVDFLTAKKGTAEAFFQIINRLIVEDRLIAVSSQVRPADLPGCEAKLRSRLAMGLVARMDLPDAETRKEILLRKAELHGWTLAEPAARRLASCKVGSVRELEGALHEVIQQDRIGCAAPHEEVARALGELTADRRGPSPREVLDAVCEHFGTTTSALQSASRKRASTRPRHLAAYLLAEDAGTSLAEAGRLLGRDRSTVNDSVRLIAREVAAGGDAAREVDALRRRLSA